MIKYYKTLDGVIKELPEAEKGCWIMIVQPDANEISYAIESFGLDPGFVRSSLDEEESSRIENEDEQTLIIVDYPVAEQRDTSADVVTYSTVPMGIILTDYHVVTISTRQNSILNELAAGSIKGINTNQKTRFVLQILLRIAVSFLQCLKQIDKISYLTEVKLHKYMKNKEIMQMLDLEKSLVYFSTSLKANEVTLEKILRGRVITMYEEDHELLEDVLIEVKQAIEMSNIYSRILSGTRDAFASIISNNLNYVMEKLTIITILMAIPTIIYSYYGMNVSQLPFADSIFPFPFVLSIIVTVSAAFIMLKKSD